MQQPDLRQRLSLGVRGFSSSSAALLALLWLLTSAFTFPVVGSSQAPDPTPFACQSVQFSPGYALTEPINVCAQQAQDSILPYASIGFSAAPAFSEATPPFWQDCALTQYIQDDTTGAPATPSSTQLCLADALASNIGVYVPLVPATSAPFYALYPGRIYHTVTTLTTLYAPSSFDPPLIMTFSSRPFLLPLTLHTRPDLARKEPTQ